jgi:hypothetical protein
MPGGRSMTLLDYALNVVLVVLLAYIINLLNGGS